MTRSPKSYSYSERRKTTAALYAYFRGSEYPPGRVRALWDAWRMSRTWPALRGVR